MLLDADRDNPGALLTHYRERAGLTPHGLLIQSGVTSQHAAYVRDYEAGLRVITKRRIVLAYARALGLTPWETDHFLFVWGFAPQIDWQRITRELMTELGLGGDFVPRTALLYRQALKTRPGDETDDPC